MSIRDDEPIIYGACPFCGAALTWWNAKICGASKCRASRRRAIRRERRVLNLESSEDVCARPGCEAPVLGESKYCSMTCYRARGPKSAAPKPKAPPPPKPAKAELHPCASCAHGIRSSQAETGWECAIWAAMKCRPLGEALYRTALPSA